MQAQCHVQCIVPHTSTAYGDAARCGGDAAPNPMPDTSKEEEGGVQRGTGRKGGTPHGAARLY